MAKWCCVKQCGACCYLEPSERPELEEYLSSEELKLYMSLVGQDGWCINYDSTSRECRIYPDRPSFCRVRADVFSDLYGIEADELDEFAIDCCSEHIGDMYGTDSPEMLRFQQAVYL